MSQTKAQLFDVSVEGPTALKNGAFDVTLGAGGNVTISDGNLVLASGSGIDFSATADGSGTMTSELLDDYEEGTWTPTYSPQNGAFASITYDPDTAGNYRKIGSLVYVSAFIRTDSLSVGTATGAILISGLPYLSIGGSGQNQSMAIGQSSAWAGEKPTGMLTSSSGSIFSLYYRTASDGDSSTLQVSDMDTGANDNQVYFAGVYIAS